MPSSLDVFCYRCATSIQNAGLNIGARLYETINRINPFRNSDSLTTETDVTNISPSTVVNLSDLYLHKVSE